MDIGKKKKLLIMAGIIVFALFSGAGFMLFRSIRKFNQTNKTLARSIVTLKDYYNKKPFPSRDNVAKEKENIKKLDNWLNNLMRDAGRGQVEPGRKKSASIFKGLLGRKKNKLLGLATKNNINLPDDFAFGFDRYSGKNRPAPDDVPRLTQQLIIIDKLSKIFFSERIEALSSIVRDEFEALSTVGGKAVSRRSLGGGRRRGRSLRGRESKGRGHINRNAGILGKDDLYAKLHFVFKFTAIEKSMFNIINRLIADDLFIVVTDLKIEKIEKDILLPEVSKETEKDDEGEEKEKNSSHSLYKRDRMVSGLKMQKPMQIEIGLDVYRFRKN